MSNLEAPANIQDYASHVLLANVKWAQRMNQTFPQYFPDPKDKQAPKMLWIGCSDSRVQESDATTALPGTVFVHRNIANQFHLHDDNALSVFAYAVGTLGVRHIAIVGHEHCGGALTALNEANRRRGPDKTERRHTISDSLYHVVESDRVNDVHDKDSKDPHDAITRWLTPLVHRVKKLISTSMLPWDPEEQLRVVVEENVKLQMEFIVQLDEWVREHAPEKPVWVHGWVYDFSTGFIRDLGITRELGGDLEMA